MGRRDGNAAQSLLARQYAESGIRHIEWDCVKSFCLNPENDAIHRDCAKFDIACLYFSNTIYDETCSGLTLSNLKKRESERSSIVRNLNSIAEIFFVGEGSVTPSSFEDTVKDYARRVDRLIVILQGHARRHPDAPAFVCNTDADNISFQQIREIMRSEEVDRVRHVAFLSDFCHAVRLVKPDPFYAASFAIWSNDDLESHNKRGNSRLAISSADYGCDPVALHRDQKTYFKHLIEKVAVHTTLQAACEAAADSWTSHAMAPESEAGAMPAHVCTRTQFPTRVARWSEP